MDSEARAVKQLDTLISRYPALAPIRENIDQAYALLRDCYSRGGKLLICGNGGSCADAYHIVGELMKGFCKKRPVSESLRERLTAIAPADGALLSEKLEQGLPAIALPAETGLNTAFANDKDPVMGFAQGVLGYGKPGDVLLGITTSGNSQNVLYALEVAQALEIRSIVLTGKDGGRAAAMADCAVIAPSCETYQIQEYHLPIYHALCLMLEERFFEE